MLNKITQQIRKQTLTLTGVSALSLMLTACGGSSSSNSNPNPNPNPVPTPDPIVVVAPTTGVWNAAAYGLLVDVNESGHTFYQTVGDYCQTFDMSILTNYSHDDLLDSMVLSDDEMSMMTTVAGQKIPGMKMEKIQALPDSCLNQLVVEGEAGYSFDPQRDFEIFWQTFQQHYAFFELENVDWDAQYQLANNQISQNTTEIELFIILSEMVKPLRDFHVMLFNPEYDAGFSVSRKADTGDVATAEYAQINNLEMPLGDEHEEAVDDYYEHQMDKALNAILSHKADDSEVKFNSTNTIGWFKTSDQLGYVYLPTMELIELGSENVSRADNMAALKTTLNEIIGDFEGLDGLIFDVRVNGGGDDFVSQTIVSYLIDQDLQAYSKQVRLGDERTPVQRIVINPNSNKQFTGPVAVLTSTTTSSAAEIFSIAMRARPNTVLVGEETGGGLSDSLPKTLPHGLFYTLSNEIYISHDGHEFEGTGVSVDIEAPFFTREQREQGIDLGLEKATEWLKNNAQ